MTDTQDGAALIAAERRRQIDEEGYTADHDAGHAHSLALAATCYAMPSHLRSLRPDEGATPYAWPWDPRYWKPTPGDRVRELVKAGALIAAEIDRLQRADAPAPRLYTDAGHRRAIPGFSLDATESAPE